MNQEYMEWILLLARWLHITVAVCWIGTSIFFMWLDRSLDFDKDSKRPGHLGTLWMVHGGGFYQVEKLLMGPTKVPEQLHWFKWESYWTWMSGSFLILLIFYTGGGSFLLDSSVSHLGYWQAVSLSVGSIVGSWFFYDFLWESTLTKKWPLVGHFLTILWLTAMTYVLCHALSGRAAYIHIGAMLGTWMTANVFLRIIPRQVKMVEAAKTGETINQEWAINAKNRSTHNTYFTLPVIFLMLSNHFSSTFGNQWNWIILLAMCLAGAAIREFFIVRIKNPRRAFAALALGIVLILATIFGTHENTSAPQAGAAVPITAHEFAASPSGPPQGGHDLTGIIKYEGEAPKEEKLLLPLACAKQFSGDVYANDALVKKGHLKNVLVRIVKGLEGKTFSDIPDETVILDQKGCLYEPRIAAVRVGQKIAFTNSDELFHNVRSVSAHNENFNEAMPNKNDRIIKTFSKAEILQTKCSVHPWMSASIAVLDHPYFSLSDENGEFNIKNLPEGQYTLEAWHEIFGSQTQEIQVGKTGHDSIEFSFKKGP